MELERFGTMQLRYDDGFQVVQPYGQQDGTGFGSGTGRIDAAGLAGDIRWANHPHRRGDGANVIDAAGAIDADDGATLVFRLVGRTIWIEEGARGAQVLQITVETADDRHRWLNDVVGLVEGVIDTTTGVIDATIFICRHPALASGGSPERDDANGPRAS